MRANDDDRLGNGGQVRGGSIRGSVDDGARRWGDDEVRLGTIKKERIQLLVKARRRDDDGRRDGDDDRRRRRVTIGDSDRKGTA